METSPLLPRNARVWRAAEESWSHELTVNEIPSALVLSTGGTERRRAATAWSLAVAGGPRRRGNEISATTKVGKGNHHIYSGSQLRRRRCWHASESTDGGSVPVLHDSGSHQPRFPPPAPTTPHGQQDPGVCAYWLRFHPRGNVMLSSACRHQRLCGRPALRAAGEPPAGDDAGGVHGRCHCHRQQRQHLVVHVRRVRDVLVERSIPMDFNCGAADALRALLHGTVVVRRCQP